MIHGRMGIEQFQTIISVSLFVYKVIRQMMTKASKQWAIKRKIKAILLNKKA
jgi:DNA polymerase II large subunit